MALTPKAVLTEVRDNYKHTLQGYRLTVRCPLCPMQFTRDIAKGAALTAFDNAEEHVYDKLNAHQIREHEEIITGGNPA